MTCTVSLPLAAGPHSGTFKTYDGVDGTGNLLSTNFNVSLTVNAGQANTFSLVLNGDIASISLALSNTAPFQGTAQTIPLSVNAYDADRNLIIGPGSYDNGPITLNDSDSSGATKLSTTTAADPSVSVSVAYNGNAIPGGSATFSASAGSIATTGAQNAVLTPKDLGTWTLRAAAPYPVTYSASASYNGLLYVLGGQAGSVFNVLQVYDPTADRWSLKTSSPAELDAGGAGFINGKMYAVSPYCYCTLAYDPASDSWHQGAGSSVPTWPSVASLNGKLYVAGGVVGNTDTQALSVYDPATDSWSQEATMPTARENAAIAAFDGKLYVAGGQSRNPGANPVPTNLEMYDPATDSWSEKASVPESCTFVIAGVINGLIYVDCSYAHTWAYDPVSDSWSMMQADPVRRNCATGAAVAGKLYSVGSCQTSDDSTLEQFTP